MIGNDLTNQNCRDVNSQGALVSDANSVDILGVSAESL